MGIEKWLLSDEQIYAECGKLGMDATYLNGLRAVARCQLEKVQGWKSPEAFTLVVEFIESDIFPMLKMSSVPVSLKDKWNKLLEDK